LHEERTGHGMVWAGTFDGGQEMEITIGKGKELVEEVFVDGVGISSFLVGRQGVQSVVVVGDNEFEGEFADLLCCWEGNFGTMLISFCPCS
jgi:hypothetical protein